jgi:hypothetical protein
MATPEEKMNAKPASIRETMFAQVADKKLFEQAKSYAYAYMDEAHRRQVFPDAEAIRKLAAFDEPLPQYSGSASAILELLDEHGSPATVAQTGGRYFGFVNGNAIPAALAARWLGGYLGSKSSLERDLSDRCQAGTGLRKMGA